LPTIRIHDARHTCAALLISTGTPGKMIQAHLGHKHITTTLGTYGHLFEDDMDRIADALDDTYKKAIANETPPTWFPSPGPSAERPSDLHR
jgi:integrase